MFSYSLVFVHSALAIKIGEAEFQAIAADVAPEVEMVAGRSFADIPSVTLDDAPHIMAEIRRSVPTPDAIDEELNAALLAHVTTSVALYVPHLARIFVNTTSAKAWLGAIERLGLPARPHVRCLLAHELAHALQHQYGVVGADLAAYDALREGHATWVAEQICDGARLEAERASSAIHLLQAPTLTDEQRPYVVGEAAVSTLIAGAGKGAYWSVLRDGTMSWSEVDHLAEGARLPGWIPERFGESLSFAADWGAPEREYLDGWLVAGGLVLDGYRYQIHGAGPAVSATWSWGRTQARATIITFASEADATRVLTNRLLSHRRGSAPALLFSWDYASIHAKPRLRRRDTPPGSLGGFSLTLRSASGVPYRELWTQQGAELRILGVAGMLSANAVGDALVEIGSLPAAGAPPGAAAPGAQNVLERVRKLPDGDPQSLAQGFIEDRLADVGRSAGDCVAEVRRWHTRLSPGAWGEAVGMAADCAYVQNDRVGLAALAAEAGEGESWDEANLVFASTAAHAGDWQTALRFAERAIGLGGREPRRDALLLAAWIQLGRVAELRTFARDPLNDEALRFEAISELWRRGDTRTATEALPLVCNGIANLPFCEGDWRARLKAHPRGAPLGR